MDLTTHNTHKTTMSYSLHTPFQKTPIAGKVPHICISVTTEARMKLDSKILQGQWWFRSVWRPLLNRKCLDLRQLLGIRIVLVKDMNTAGLVRTNYHKYTTTPLNNNTRMFAYSSFCQSYPMFVDFSKR
jgi:hypothetical protein